MTGLTLRPIAASDLPALAALEAACFPDPWSESGLSILLRPPYGGLVAERDNAGSPAVVGYVGWMHFAAMGDCAAEAEITRICASPDARRCGIGRALLSEMLASLGRPLSVYLDVRASNAPAQGLYEAFGFAARGVRPRFYGDEDAVEYELRLT